MTKEKSRAKKSKKNQVSNQVKMADRIQLLMLYQDEQKQRDSNFWKQIFMYFIAVICIEAMPLGNCLGFKCPPSESIPYITYPIVGFILSITEILVINAYKKRFDCINESYDRVMKTIPEELQREKLNDKPIHLKYFVKKSMAIFIGYCIVGIQIFFSCVIVLSLKNL